VVVHLLSSIAVIWGAYFLLTRGSLVALIAALVVVSALEGAWLYFLFRK